MFSERIKLGLTFLFLTIIGLSCSKEEIAGSCSGNYEQAITAFEEQDKKTPPEPGAILFIGSSSIRLWEDLSHRFNEYPIVRRGFGGSGICDIISYADRIIFPYQPSLVFIYSGENDLATGQEPNDATFKQFVRLYDLISHSIPETKICYISVKPSPARKQLMPAFKYFNQKVENHLVKNRNWTFLDVYHPMLGSGGLPLDSIFTIDNLHMNDRGYDIWEKVIRNYLEYIHYPKKE
jgi:hypothetical protein